jgi:DNA-binding transcriptional ArsR family regulator
MAGRDPVKLTDPKAIRALAHPARLTVIEELYSGRELTATECADLAGLSPSAMSYHLRSLEKAGIVERAEATTDGRERPWRAAGSYLQVETESYVAEAAALSTTLLTRLNSQFAEWQQRRASEPKRWRDASVMGNGQIWLRLEELEAFGAAIDELVDKFRERSSGERPADARRIRFTVFAFPGDRPPQ